MVVVNITNKDLKIPEIRSIVPADGKQYILPYDIAIKYKAFLKPIQMQDASLMQMQESDEPITQQIQEMNYNAVSNLQQLEQDLKLQIQDKEKNLIPQKEDTTTSEDWDKKSKFDKIKTLFEKNPDFTIKKISEYSETSYVYAQKVISKLKKANKNA